MTFLHYSYHWSAHPGELDEAELSTFHHTFFSFFFRLGVVGRCSGRGSGAPHSACPSLSCCIMKHCSSLRLSLKNMSFFPTRKRISPLPTSILTLADLRKGRPSTRSTPRSPSISITTKSARMKESHTHTKTGYPFRISNCRICKLYEHSCGGKSRIIEFFVYYLGHYIHASSQIA